MARQRFGVVLEFRFGHSIGMTGYGERRAALDNERKQLDRQKPFAWLLLVIGLGLFAGNNLGMMGTPDLTLETVGLIAVLIGGFWLWHIRSELERKSRRSMEQDKEQQRLGGEQ